ncbi:MAG: SDR family oxidoreductase, partial [Clostridia bacterium]|nr:SDR family oxidoreductase [Clostridia bacterium]
GITVNCVAPGAIETRMISHMSDRDKKDFAGEIPLGRLGTPRDVAGAILFLASDEADYITGSVICPDGGVTI